MYIDKNNPKGILWDIPSIALYPGFANDFSIGNYPAFIYTKKHIFNFNFIDFFIKYVSSEIIFSLFYKFNSSNDIYTIYKKVISFFIIIIFIV